MIGKISQNDMKRKAHVLVEYESYVETAKSISLFLSKMAKEYNFEVRERRTRNVAIDDVVWADTIVSVREMCRMSAYIANLCNELGKNYIVMLDDFLLEHRRRDRHMKMRKRWLREQLESATLLWASQPFLAETIASRVRIKKYVSPQQLIVPPFPETEWYELHEGEPVRIAYYCNDGTEETYNTLFRPCLEEIANRSQREIQISLFAIVNRGLKDPPNCHTIYVPHLSSSEFREKLKNGKFHIGIAPLDDNNIFNKCKGCNKYVEYTMAGIFGIYENCLPYTLAVRENENGLMCESAREDWISAVIKAINDNELRKRCLENAQKDLRENYSYAAAFKKFAQQMPELFERKDCAAPTIGQRMGMRKAAVQQIAFMCSERMGSAVRALREGGLKRFKERTAAFVRAIAQAEKEKKRDEKRKNGQ